MDPDWWAIYHCNPIIGSPYLNVSVSFDTAVLETHPKGTFIASPVFHMVLYLFRNEGSGGLE